ncbi:uncharacterized protein EKO05_0006716 [Ascochyta rabiei]|uniref:uncharacterized protein n=1 Tax=Didymella rabiei TaxID=5454 RepID=UPI0021FB2C23|nr:uncharacterized protein EKO05_0006716 [Ascochyta rabiei]UPX16307.1 hypothetical protein EKO05_0006716 [Ascochyta rabiei]
MCHRYSTSADRYAPQRAPSKVTVATRKSLAAAVRALPNLAWSPGDVRVPRPAKEPIFGLKSREDGLVCLLERCWYTCISLQGMQKHCKDKHGWVNKQKRGGDIRQKSKHSRNQVWRDSQSCQRLFRAVGWPAYVAVETSVGAATLADISQRVKADRQHQREEREAAAAQDKIKEGIRSQADPWLELTEWVPHLQGIPRAALLRAKQLAGREVDARGKEEVAFDNTGLRDVCKAIERLIQKRSIAAKLRLSADSHWRLSSDVRRAQNRTSGPSTLGIESVRSRSTARSW